MSGVVFIDCETTGVDPERHHLWEIGMVTNNGEFEWVLELDDDERRTADAMALAIGRYYERSNKAYEAYIIDQRFMPNMAATWEEWAKEMQERKYISVSGRYTLAKFIAAEISTAHLVGAVPSFDARFVGDFLRKHSFPPSWHYHLVDIEALAAGKLGWEPPWRSRDLYTELGIDLSQFDAHTALGDARMAKAVYEKVYEQVPAGIGG